MRKTLDDVIGGCDVFLGLSGPGVLTPEMVKKMAERPIILAMANPEPEIRPELAKQARPDCLVGTGRSDYPNQVNNSLCFPFIFRGALDCGATKINEEMKLAATRALAELARAEPSDIVALAYGEATPPFGPDYLIPRAFDPRLITSMAPAVAKAAMDSGVATRPIKDFDAYREHLARFVYESGATMEPVFAAAKRSPKRVAFAEGEDERVLRAAQAVVDEGFARPVLVGRLDVIASRIQKLGLRLTLGGDCDGVNILDDPRYRDYWSEYYRLARRKGVTRRQAQEDMRTPPDAGGFDARAPRRRRCDALRHGQQLAGAPALHPAGDRLARRREDAGRDADADPARPPALRLRHARQSRSDRGGDRRDDAARGRGSAAVRRQAVGRAPVALELRQLRRAVRGQDARGAVDDPRARAEPARSRARCARTRRCRRPSAIRSSRTRCLTEDANLLIMPNVDAANITYNALRVTAGGGITVGGILLGAAKAVHIMTPSSTVRRIVNMTAVAVADAGAQRGKQWTLD